MGRDRNRHKQRRHNQNQNKLITRSQAQAVQGNYTSEIQLILHYNTIMKDFLRFFKSLKPKFLTY